MHDISKTFNRFKYKKDKLLKYGFKENKNKYTLDQLSTNKDFIFHIEIENKEVSYEVIDTKTNDEYLPFYIDSINGEYVGSIRDEFNLLINTILSTCFDKDFENVTLKRVIDYVKKEYNVSPEYLWEDTPNTFVFKHPGSKWFGIVMDISYKKVGINSNDIVYVMNVKVPTEEVDSLVKESGIVPAYHMNKKHWISILLDGSLNIKKIKELIDISFELTK